MIYDINVEFCRCWSHFQHFAAFCYCTTRSHARCRPVCGGIAVNQRSIEKPEKKKCNKRRNAGQLHFMHTHALHASRRKNILLKKARISSAAQKWDTNTAKIQLNHALAELYVRWIWKSRAHFRLRCEREARARAFMYIFYFHKKSVVCLLFELEKEAFKKQLTFICWFSQLELWSSRSKSWLFLGAD